MPKNDILDKNPTPRALAYIRKYFKDKEFTQGEYSNIVGEKIDRWTLKSLTRKGFLREEPGVVIRYTYTGKEGDCPSR